MSRRKNVLKENKIPAELDDTFPFYECQGELREAKSILSKLQQAIQENKKYYPAAAMENIERMVEQITKQQSVLSDEMKKYCDKVKEFQSQ